MTIQLVGAFTRLVKQTGVPRTSLHCSPQAQDPSQREGAAPPPHQSATTAGGAGVGTELTSSLAPHTGVPLTSLQSWRGEQELGEHWAP